jgi:hypothetical protein
MRTTLLALSVLLVSVANAQPHESDQHDQPQAPSVQQTLPQANPPSTPRAQPPSTLPRWSVTIVSGTRSNRYIFNNVHDLLKSTEQLIDDKTLFIMLHRNEQLVERWSRPPE